MQHLTARCEQQGESILCNIQQPPGALAAREVQQPTGKRIKEPLFHQG